jgi:3-oxoacyl-[acyl-carrier protein] reductase
LRHKSHNGERMTDGFKIYYILVVLRTDLGAWPPCSRRPKFGHLYYPQGEVLSKLTGLGVEAVNVQASGSDRDAPSRIVALCVKKWGKIDIMINNAGAGDDCLLQDMSHEMWDKFLDCNLRFPTFLIKESLPSLGTHPRIVNVSSVIARMGGSYSTAYCAFKAALEGVTKVWAREMGQKYNAAVNRVNPGPIATDMWLKKKYGASSAR